MSLLDLQKRRELHADLWSRVEQSIKAAPRETGQRDWPVLLIAPLLLPSYKVVELAFESEPGLAFKLVPLLIAIAVFAFIKREPVQDQNGIEARRRVAI